MRFTKIIYCSIILFLSTALLTSTTFAASANQYGKNNPFTVSDLPPGQLKNRLQSLPAPARNNAVAWMHRFDFTDQDLPTLRIDDNGGVFYEDPAADNSEIESSNAVIGPQENVSFVEAFSLHSKPGASRTVFLDMDGRVVSGTLWNQNSGTDPLLMRPYDSDGDEISFNQTELNAIAETWKRIAEDFAPFDIDVTTEDPGSFGPEVGVILVTPKADENNNEIYSCNCGGVAYVGVWGLSNFASAYQPALVFTDGVGTGPHNISEAASHELGHNLGLSHDNTNSVGYYTGHGTGNVDWAPIMGVGYNATLTQWSKGEYANANQTQDDLQIIAGNLSYRVDDHADNDFNAASALVINGTAVTATNPVSDAANLNPENKGIIEDRNDVDLFVFESGAGTIDLTITPAWIESHLSQSYRGMNVDIQATLYDEFGVELTSSNPANDTFAQINFAVSGGSYLLAIEGVGAGDVLGTGYSDYGSLGQYFINGTVPELIVDDTIPVANFVFDCVELFCTFDGASSTDSDGSIVEYSWVFNDPASSSVVGNPVELDFGVSGTYSVSLKVTDNDGKTDTQTQDVTVRVPVPPVANFTSSCTDLGCSFNANASSDDGSIVSYAWDFGDVSSGSGVNTSHNYNSAGTYTVTLTVTDDEALSSSTSQTVTVTEPPPAPPASPTNLTASVVKEGKGKKAVLISVDLTWSDNADNETAYIVERCLETGKGKNKACNFASYASLGADVSNYSDPSPVSGSQYRVKASNAVGDSAYSNTVKP